MQNQKGFSLIELLIVVVIIGIVAAIAIPNLPASRRAANEGSAVSTLRTYHGVQVTYQTSTGAGNYAGIYGTINAFADLANAKLMAPSFTVLNGSGYAVKSGYQFGGWSRAASGGNPASFSGGCSPVTASGATQTGTKNYGVLTDGVIISGSGAIIYGATADTISGYSAPVE